MQFVINNKVLELTNERASIEQIYVAIDEFSSSSDVIFSHLNVDGLEIYEDHEAYMEEKIEHIELVEAIFTPVREFINKLLISANTYLEGALPEIAPLSEEYYQGTNATTWDKFSQLVEGIQWIVQMVETIGAYSETRELMLSLTSQATSLIDILQTLENAIKQSDMVLLGDMINYEIKPLLESMKSDISTIIDNEVPRHDLD